MSISRARRSGIQAATSPKKARSLQDSSGIPGPVQSVSAVATGNSTISITWAAPVNSGDSAITSYTVTGSGTIAVSFASASASVTGLAANTAYSFTITAVNAVGSGVPVNTASVTTLNFNVATGGTETTVPNYNGTGETWRVHEFTSPGTLTFSQATGTVRVYIGGGNSGGGSSACCGSCASNGSYGGQFTSDAFAISAQAYNVEVGGGGAGGAWTVGGTAGSPGGTSSFAGTSRSGGSCCGGGSFTVSNIRGSGNQNIGQQSWTNACGDGVNGSNGIGGRVIVAYRSA